MAMQGSAIRVKRVYDEPTSDDGTRVLIDRLWPRGISKERAHIDLWLKEVAPSQELRTWFGHDPEKFVEFRRRYEVELASGKAYEALTALRELAQRGPITLIFAARDAEHANARVLQELLMQAK
ncbi:MAG: DUF488 domain-containing protein [Ktedonobacteraceae bacterium]